MSRMGTNCSRMGGVWGRLGEDPGGGGGGFWGLGMRSRLGVRGGWLKVLGFGSVEWWKGLTGNEIGRVIADFEPALRREFRRRFTLSERHSVLSFNCPRQHRRGA